MSNRNPNSIWFDEEAEAAPIRRPPEAAPSSPLRWKSKGARSQRAPARSPWRRSASAILNRRRPADFFDGPPSPVAKRTREKPVASTSASAADLWGKVTLTDEEEKQRTSGLDSYFGQTHGMEYIFTGECTFSNVLMVGPDFKDRVFEHFTAAEIEFATNNHRKGLEVNVLGGDHKKFKVALSVWNGRVCFKGEALKNYFLSNKAEGRKSVKVFVCRKHSKPLLGIFLYRCIRASSNSVLNLRTG